MLKQKLQTLGITHGTLTNGMTVNDNFIRGDIPMTTIGTTYVNYDPEKDRLRKDLQDAQNKIKELERELLGEIVCYGKITNMDVTRDSTSSGMIINHIPVDRTIEILLIVEDVHPAIMKLMQHHLKITFEVDDR